MRYAVVVPLALIVSSMALGQGRGETSATPGKSSRDALIKSAVARERGEITAMEASSGDGSGVIVGYESGAVAHCYGDQYCREFEGTPGGAVTGAVRDIVVSRRGTGEIIWVAYPHGILYQCVNYACREFSWQAAGDE